MAESCSFGEMTLPEKYALRSASGVVSTPHFLQSCSGFLKLRFGRFLAENLADLEEAHQPVAHAHRHRAVAQTDRAGDRLRFAGGLMAQAFLRLQAGGARAAFFGKQRAKSVLIALAVVRQLPGFDRLQGDGQAGQVAESASRSRGRSGSWSAPPPEPGCPARFRRRRCRNRWMAVGPCRQSWPEAI